jgi:predicted LPLAT superfamily acyltransferase
MSAQRAAWAEQPERSSVAVLRLMTWLSLRCGRTLSRLLLYPIAAYFLLTAPAARRASRDYLRRALGRAAGWRDGFRHFFTFSATIHDRVYLLNGRFDSFDVEIFGETELRSVLRADSGAILLGAHFGSFEILHALGERQPDLRVVTAMYEENARKINAALGAINPNLRHDIIPLGHIDTMLQIEKQLGEGALIGMLGDRSPHRDGMLGVRFLGDDAQFPLGPMRVAAVLRRRVVFMTGEYLGGNRYAIRFEPIADFTDLARSERAQAVDAGVRAFAACLERRCRETPYNWFNFYDFWKPAAVPPQ